MSMKTTRRLLFAAFAFLALGTAACGDSTLLDGPATVGHAVFQLVVGRKEHTRIFDPAQCEHLPDSGSGDGEMHLPDSGS